MNRFNQLFSHVFSFCALLGSKARYYTHIIVVICLTAIFCNCSVKAFVTVPSEVLTKRIDSRQMIDMGVKDNDFSQDIRLYEVKNGISKGIPKSRANFSELDKPLYGKSSKDSNKSNDDGDRPSWNDYIYAVLLGLLPVMFLCSIPILNEMRRLDRET